MGREHCFKKMVMMSFVVSWLTPRCRGSGDRNVAEGQVQGEEIQAPGLWEL